MIVLPSGFVFANRFEIDRIAGTGGMGAVYRTRDRFTQDIVALKLLQESGAGDVERFAREAHVLAELSHPGIVSYVAHGQAPDGQRFLAMEWLEGEDLAQRLARGPLPLRDTLLLLTRAAEALAAAHQRGIIHRDIKPSNVFISGGDFSRAKLLDFGVARRLRAGTAMTRTGLLVGTPEYMAPEQARSARDITAAADIFSLGCVIYECLSGEPPFCAEHIAAVLVRILFEEPTPISERRPGIPESLLSLLHRMLAKEPGQRIASAVDLFAALAAIGEVTEPAMPAAPILPVSSTKTIVFAESEKILFSVVIASLPESAAGMSHLAAPTASGLAPEQRQGLEEALRALGAHVAYLASGTLAVTVRQIGSATDQAALAARAALLIRERWPAAAVALATGRGTRNGGRAVGEVVDRAVRSLPMHGQAGAAPQTPYAGIWLDELSVRLLDTRFSTIHAPGGVLLTGEKRDVDASRLLLGKPTPCVGREVEIGALEAQLTACIEEGEACAVLVTAAPGMGKSRLRHEFLRRVSQRGVKATVLLGRGDLIGGGAPYGILGQAVRRLCGLSGGEPLEEQRRRLRGRLCQHVAPAEAERVSVFVGELSGVPFPAETDAILAAAREDPRIMRDRMRRAFLDWLAAESRAVPLLLVLDDLQWGDVLSTALVDDALRELRAAPLFVFALGRPEVHELFPLLWQGHGLHEVALKSLSRRACERLIHQVLGERAATVNLARMIEQSAGNALFLEELIRAAADGQSEGGPETVLAMLQVRIGRFETGPRRAVSAAALFGQTFWVGGVAALLGLPAGAAEIQRWLSMLVEVEMIEAHSTSRLPGEAEYGFRHALVRDAAYSLLVESDQASGHRLASQFLERAGETDAMTIAEHAERGGDPQCALTFFTRAAEEALERYDLEGALLRADRAIRCGPQSIELGMLYALQSTAQTLRYEWPAAYALGQQALTLLPPGAAWWCRAIDNLALIAASLPEPGPIQQLSERFAGVDPARAASVPHARAACTFVAQFGLLGERERARSFFDIAQRDCDSLPAGSAEAARAYLDSCLAWQTLFSEADPWLALCCGLRSCAYPRLTEDCRNLIVGLITVGLAQGELGDIAQGIQGMREAYALGERIREPFMVLLSKAYLLQLLGLAPTAETEAEAQQLIAAFRELPNPTVRGIALVAGAQFALHQGNITFAETGARAALLELPLIIPLRLTALCALTQSLRLQGRSAESLTLAQEGLEILAKRGGSGFAEVPLRLAASEAFAAVGDAGRARAELRETLHRIQIRADNIPEASWRQSYLTRNPACVHAQRLAQQWQLP